MSMHTHHQTLISHTFPIGLVHDWTRYLLIVILGSLLIALSSKIQVPFYPVPMTLQTMFVLLFGMALGWRLASATIFLYLIEGALGFPVFAGTPEKGLGLTYMLGGTGGYLFGFIIAAATCGWLAERGWGRNVTTTVAAMLIGNVLIYIPGLLWLGIIFGWEKPILSWGFLPFLWGDLLKLGLAAAIMPLAWKLVNKGT